MVNSDKRNLPEQGQIVTVRQRRYIVMDVQQSTLPPEPLSVQTDKGGYHLLTLNCIEDDGMGETIRVFWELEPRTSIEEKIGLPQVNGFDAPDQQD